MSVLSFFNSKPARKGGNGAAPAPVAAAPEPPVDDAAALSRETGIVLDALGAVMQYYAKFAFDTDTRSGDEVRRLTHAWMLHATMGSPRPDHEGDKPSAGVFYRDWKGIVHFFGEQ